MFFICLAKNVAVPCLMFFRERGEGFCARARDILHESGTRLLRETQRETQQSPPPPLVFGTPGEKGREDTDRGRPTSIRQSVINWLTVGTTSATRDACGKDIIDSTHTPQGW